MEKQCGCGISRRQFLRAAGGAVACCALFPLSDAIALGDPISVTPVFPKGRARVDLVFVHVASPRPTWPSKDYDYAARVKELTEKLTQACPGIRFTPKRAANAEEANAILKEPGNRDGYLVYVLSLSAPGVEAFVRSGRPVVLVDDLFGGTAQVLKYSGVATREKLPLVAISSSDFEDVVRGACLLEVIRAMKETTILDVTDRNIEHPTEEVRELYGANLIRLTSEELAAYYAKTDEREAAAWADYWMGNARRVVEPTREEVVKSGRMYLALSRAAEERRADAVTMNCLGLFYAKRSPAYPCLAFFQMNNDGGTGVCEGDANSTCTQLLMRYLTGRPGYVSDPVIDTSKGEIIYAHCVATNRAYGPKGKANPYIIRSHAEDGQGAAVQSLLPANDTVTSLVISNHARRMVIHTGRAVGNLDEPKACRTKLVAKANAATLLRNWDLGWHRVTVYGNWRRQAMNLARLLGIEVFEEDQPA